MNCVKDYLRLKSLQTKLSLCLLIMNIVLVIFSLRLIVDAVEVNEQANRISAVSMCSESLFSTIEALAFERGRTNVILSAGSPITAADRVFIEERRTQVDKNLGNGLQQLSEIEPEAAERLRGEYAEFLKLREKANIQVGMKLGDRETAFADEWFTQSTAFIFRIKEMLELLGQKDMAFDQFYFNYHFQLDCVEFRLTSGYSASILTAALSQGTISPEKYREFIESRGKADYIWASINRDMAKSDNSAVRSKKDWVFHEYYGVYRPMQNQILNQALVGTVPPDLLQRLAALSVPAFDSIFDLIGEVGKGNQNYVAEIQTKADTGLKRALFESFLILIFILFTLIYFRNMLFSPIKRIINALHSIVNGQTAPDLEVEAVRQDEIGYLAQGVKLLQLSMEEERRLKTKNEMLAITDSLTGIYNRKKLDQEVECVMAQADRYGESVSIILLDLDRFKNVNDTWGHQVGDEVLIQTAQVVSQVIRKTDLFFRFGGEEFLVLMSQTNANGAVAAAEKIRVALEDARHPQAGQVTASLGVAERGKGEACADFYKRADDNLYRAKKYGRNRVVYSTIAPVHMVWRPEWESGHPEIDSQHQKLLELAEEFFEMCMLSNLEPENVQPMLEKLFAELDNHFCYEEQLLERLDYPGVEEHKLKHKQIFDKAAAFKENYLQGELNTSSFVSFILDDVVLGHMLKDDKLFFPYTQQQTSD